MSSAARAMLWTVGVQAHTHKGVISQFSERFVRSRRVEAVHARSLRWVHDLRRRGDYGIEGEVGREEAEVALTKAKAFVRIAETFLGEP